MRSKTDFLKKRPSIKWWAKPTVTQKEQCVDTLNEVEVTFCAICSKEDDPNDFVCWIQCVQCDFMGA